MIGSDTWQRRFAQRLVRHAAAVLRASRPEWAAALESELEHVPGRYRALMWAVGCVRASYIERYLGRSRPLLTAIAVGLAFALLDELVTGVIAAVPWPHWYVVFAGTHKHLSLELWSIVAETLPITLIGAGFGALLARLANSSKTVLPCVSIAVWVLYWLVPIPALCVVPLRVVWDAILLAATSNVASIILPGCALFLGFCRARDFQDQNPRGTSPAGCP
jgi:hypothetical protein